jgi:hypothetical protein
MNILIINKFKVLLFILIQCCILLPIKAVELPWYEIEILVFEQSNQPRLESEKWQQPEQLANIEESHNFISPPPSSVLIKELCVNGNIIPIIEQLETTVIIDEIVDEIPDEAIEQASIVYTANSEPSNTTMDDSSDPFDEPFVKEKPFVILDKSFNQLNGVMTSLKRRRGYHPLIHMTWRQPVEKKNNSQNMRLFAGINYADTFNPKGDARVNMATIDPSLIETDPQFMNSPMDRIPAETFSFQQQLILANVDPRAETKRQLNACQLQYQIEKDKRVTDVWQLDGNIRIYAERYLHLETDLFLSIPGKKEVQLSALETSLAADRMLNSLQLNSLEPNDDATTLDNGFGWQLGEDFLLENQNDGIVLQDVLNRYVIQQTRRIRRDETHYIDHPLFGVLIQIRAYDGNLPPNDDLAQ